MNPASITSATPALAAPSSLDGAACAELYRRLKRHIPEPRTELRYKTSFELLIAVMLSAQATDISVNKATATLFKEASTPQAMKKLGLRRLKQHIRTIGLYNTKAANILATCDVLLRQHKGRVPSGRDALEELPGVGRKTANVVLNTAFGQPTIAVDTHIFRVCNRTGLARGTTPLAVEKRLQEVTPARYKINAHHWLILHGRYTCTARAPRCSSCVLRSLCLFAEKSD